MPVRLPVPRPSAFRPPPSAYRLPLRARLTLAFAAISVVTLLLAGAAFVFILQDYQTRREVNRVAELTLPLSGQVRALEQLGASTEEVVEYVERQAEELDLRVVLADARGFVFLDTEDALVGRQLRIDREARFGLQRRVRVATAAGPEGEITLMVSPNINPVPGPQAPAVSPTPVPGTSVGERFLGRPSAYVVALSVPRQSIATAWLELLPRLSLAAAAALLLSSAVAWPLAASIARPLARMTGAAEAMARGRLDQQIAVEGRDEVGRLAAAFNRMAREVSSSQRTLRDFLANVSHDLRTPLTSIQGFSQALMEGTVAEPGEVAETGRIINEESARMGRLVDDVLFLSRMEAGQAPIRRRETDLAELVGARVRAWAARAGEAGVALRWQADGAPRVMADPTLIERVVDNLLENAVRHAASGGAVTIGLSEGALLTVHNGGSQIPPDDLARVFERFYQVDKARSAGGSGLGLAISREIVQAHGGRCWAESSAEGGTTFFVRLPGLRDTPAVAAGPAETGPLTEREAVIPVGSAGPAER